MKAKSCLIQMILFAVVIIIPAVTVAEVRSIKVGLLTPMTGLNPPFGKGQDIALHLALEAVNARGGINGVEVKGMVYDTGGHPDKLEWAKERLRRLADKDQVLAVIGPFYSFECQALFPVANEVKTPLIATASSKPGLSDLEKYPYAFRMTVTEDKMAAVQLKAWVKAHQIKGVAIIYDKKDPTASTMGKRVWPVILKKLGIEIVNESHPITFITEQRDFHNHVKQLLSCNPDGICISAFDKEAAHIAKEIRHQGSGAPLCGRNQSLSNEFIRIAGPAAEGFWAVGLFYPVDPNPKVQEYVKAFTERCTQKYPREECTPEQYDVVVYDIVHFIADIMKKRGISGDPERLQEERDKIRDGLAHMGVWRGTAGMMAFDKKGDGIRTIHVLKVKDGTWQPAY